MSKVRILRFWIAVAIVAAIGLCDPAIWFGVVPLFFFPSCLCCPAPGGDCGSVDPVCQSGTRPANATVVIAGMSGTSPCDPTQVCSDLDGTFVLPFDFDSTHACFWKTIQAVCTCNASVSSESLFLIAQLNVSGPSSILMQVKYQGLQAPTCAGFDTQIWRSADFGTRPADCTGFGEISCPPLSSPGACSNTGSTCDVTLSA